MVYEKIGAILVYLYADRYSKQSNEREGGMKHGTIQL